MNEEAKKRTLDLESCFGELVQALSMNGSKGFTFTANNFPELPNMLEADQIVVKRRHVNYDDFRADQLQFFTSKPMYHKLAFLILSVVFRPGGSRVHVALTNPSSDIKSLIIEYTGSTTRISGHHTVPQKFTFYLHQVSTHPWTGQNPDLCGFPRFVLTNMKQFVVSEEDWANRDTVMGFGNDDVSVRLADLLLNFGSSQNRTNEILLEGEGGFRGVGVHSAEAAFYLPGSLAWPDGVELNSLFSAE